MPPVPWTEKCLILASWEPVWGTFDPSSPHYWRRYDPHLPFWCSLQFANPIMFVGAAALTALGVFRRWLTTPEWLMAAALLAMGYVFRGYEMAMHSQGRYAGVAVPVYIVLGRVLAALPTWLAAALLGAFSFLLAVYSALFAAGYVLL
jgi:hypothetical protein